jgi:uncharacterized membrane protein HdeD (DUF308 family)
MTLNEGTIDRMIRVVVGVALLGLPFVGVTTVWAYLGLFPLITGVVGVCPLYSVLGWTTRAADES